MEVYSTEETIARAKEIIERKHFYFPILHLIKHNRLLSICGSSCVIITFNLHAITHVECYTVDQSGPSFLSPEFHLDDDEYLSKKDIFWPKEVNALLISYLEGVLTLFHSPFAEREDKESFGRFVFTRNNKSEPNHFSGTL